MFKKILIANRGEIAVRIVRTCREMGIRTVSLYDPSDRSSLHVRLADECVQLPSPGTLFDPQAILAIAKEKKADAIHPGYGFLAEESSFIETCTAAGIAFIGPPAGVVESLTNKIRAQEIVSDAGFPTPQHSKLSFDDEEFELIASEADNLGYPVIIKSCTGGRGRGERLAILPRHLPEAVRQAQAIGHAIYGNRRVYLEKAILPVYQVGVQIMADQQGNIIHLGDREGSILQKGQKIIEETPARCLDQRQREKLQETALQIARLFNYQNLGTVEFLVDKGGNFYFSEIKARIQVEHSLPEMITRLDLVREQIRIAAGEPLPLRQEDVWLGGWAMMCRVRANDPWRDFLPSPGKIKRISLPGGPEIRVDTHVYSNSTVPSAYDPLLANLTVWGSSRAICLHRMQRALEDFKIVGRPTNLPLLQKLTHAPAFMSGEYATDFRVQMFDAETAGDAGEDLRDLAAAVAILYVRRNQSFNPQPSARITGHWHASARQIQGQ